MTSVGSNLEAQSKPCIHSIDGHHPEYADDIDLQAGAGRKLLQVHGHLVNRHRYSQQDKQASYEPGLPMTKSHVCLIEQGLGHPK